MQQIVNINNNSVKTKATAVYRLPAEELCVFYGSPLNNTDTKRAMNIGCHLSYLWVCRVPITNCYFFLDGF